MDFITKMPSNFFRVLSRARFSIRVSILTLVLSLLVGTAASILSINYFTINSILMTSSSNYLEQTSGKVAEQISNYISPLDSNVNIGYQMITSGLIKPGSRGFTRFLSNLIITNPNIVGAYWADVNGSMYWVNDRDDGSLVEKITLRTDNGIKITQINMDKNWQIISVDDPKNLNVVDPRQRPWYQQAELKRGLNWTVYSFVTIGSQKPQLGVTSSIPIYDKGGKLLGVLGVDMLLGTINKYVSDIELTENSSIYVVDSAGKLIASRMAPDDDLDINYTHLVSDIDTSDNPDNGFAILRDKKLSHLIHSKGGRDYVVAHKRIASYVGDYPWIVGVVTPVDDIIAPLRHNIILGAVFAGIALVIGVILASIFSSSISKPIKRLAQDADLICQLKLESIRYLFSRIKEIAGMAESFIKMKNALYSFQRYMPINLVKKLMLSNKIATVGGESKDLSILFTDIKDFTKLSEGFEPEHLMRYLSEYFQSITKVIIDSHGTVDKYIGDGVMAFWGAPIDDADHVLHSCWAVLRIQEELQRLNNKWRHEHKPEVATRFGLSSGRVIVGNVGSDEKLSYTSLGDHVNLASRLESLNKMYGTNAIVSESVYEKAKHGFKFRLLDRVAVRGKTHGGYIYELIGEKMSEQQDSELDNYNREFYKAFSVYEKGDWKDAMSLFTNLGKRYPDDQITKMFIERSVHFIANPPKDWHGVWVLE